MVGRVDATRNVFREEYIQREMGNLIVQLSMIRKTDVSRIVLLCTAFFLAALNCRKTEERSLLKLIEEHQSRYSHFEVQDAYKLIYQGVFGVAHILENKEAAWQYLQREFESLEASEDEPLLENISLRGDVVRINLRPFKAANASLEKLFEVMVQSAGEIQSTEEEFSKQWNEFQTLVRNETLSFDINTLEEFDSEVRAAHFPPVHHSEGYEEANRPAYRVVKRTLFEKTFGSFR